MVVLLLWLVKLAMTRRMDRSFDIAVALFIASGLLSSYAVYDGLVDPARASDNAVRGRETNRNDRQWYKCCWPTSSIVDE
jgi:hypothetical protein